MGWLLYMVGLNEGIVMPIKGDVKPYSECLLFRKVLLNRKLDKNC